MLYGRKLSNVLGLEREFFLILFARRPLRALEKLRAFQLELITAAGDLTPEAQSLTERMLDPSDDP